MVSGRRVKEADCSRLTWSDVEENIALQDLRYYGVCHAQRRENATQVEVGQDGIDDEVWALFFYEAPQCPLAFLLNAA